jgi:phage shock protein PspC (stress-responsive transcriptional regulator)
MNEQKRLYKTKDGAMIGGVLKGISEVYNWDVALVRILFLVLTLFVVGSPILLYLIFYLVLPPKETVIQEKQKDPYDLSDEFYD